MGKNKLPIRVIAPGLMGKQYSRYTDMFTMGSAEIYKPIAPVIPIMYVSRVVSDDYPLRIEVPDAWAMGSAATCFGLEDIIDVGGGRFKITTIDYGTQLFSIDPIDSPSFKYAVVAGDLVSRRGCLHAEMPPVFQISDEEQFWIALKLKLEMESYQITKSVEELTNEFV